MKKDLSYYLKLKYSILISQDEDNGESFYEAEIPDLPGCGAYGKNIDEALNRLEEAKKLWIESRLKRSLSIPEPVSRQEFSGKYPLRISPGLHMKLTINARNERLSLNQYMRKTLESNITLESVMQKIEELSKEVKSLSQKIATTSEAGLTEWIDQFSQAIPASPVIETANWGVTYASGTFSGASIFLNYRDVTHPMTKLWEGDKNIDLLELQFSEEEK